MANKVSVLPDFGYQEHLSKLRSLNYLEFVIRRPKAADGPSCTTLSHEQHMTLKLFSQKARKSTKIY